MGLEGFCAFGLKLRTRLIELYDGQLQEPERSMPHIEAVLAKDPPNDEARRVAQKLLNVKGLASRAASALAEAFDKWGRPEDVARFLAIELEHTRGPKRFGVLRPLWQMAHRPPRSFPPSARRLDSFLMLT